MEDKKETKAIDTFIEKVKKTCEDASGFLCIAFKDVMLDDGRKGIKAISDEPIVVGPINIYYASQKLLAAKKRADEIKDRQNIIASCTSEKEVNELLG